MYNKVILIGNLTRDAELKYTQQGTSLCNFGIAVNRKYGEKEEVYFGEVTAWGKLGETCHQYMSKGSRVLVEGRLVTESWESNGEKKSKTRIVAENIRFLSARRENAENKETDEPEPF